MFHALRTDLLNALCLPILFIRIERGKNRKIEWKRGKHTQRFHFISTNKVPGNFFRCNSGRACRELKSGRKRKLYNNEKEKRKRVGGGVVRRQMTPLRKIQKWTHTLSNRIIKKERKKERKKSFLLVSWFVACVRSLFFLFPFSFYIIRLCIIPRLIAAEITRHTRVRDKRESTSWDCVKSSREETRYYYNI